MPDEIDDVVPQMSFTRKLVFSLLLFVFTFLFIFGIGEIAVRLLSPTGYVTPDTMRENSLEYQPAVFARSIYPQRVQYAEGGRVRINNLGYRGKDFSIDKSKDVIRIVCIGGSQVLDGAQKEGHDWSALLERDLRTSGHKVEVINAGVAGNASCDSLGRFFSEIWMLQPDYVIVCHAWNDLKYFKNIKPDNSILRTIQPPRFIRLNNQQLIWNPYIYYSGALDRFMCHSQLYVRLRNRYWSLKLGKIGFEGLLTGKLKDGAKKDGTENTVQKRSWNNKWAIQQYKLNMELIAEATKNIGAIPILLTQPRLVTATTSPAQRKRIMYGYIGLSHNELVDAFKQCDDALMDISKKENVMLIDTAAMTGNPALFRDHVHLTAEGSERLASLITSKLAPALDK